MKKTKIFWDSFTERVNAIELEKDKDMALSWLPKLQTLDNMHQK